MLSATPIISEFVASNDNSLTDGDGNTPDWIEIYNPTANAFDLQGWHLTDDVANPAAWTFPDLPQSELAPGEYLVVFASGQDADDYIDAGGNLHTNFKLSSGGEYLGLIESDGTTVASEYAPEYPEQSTDVSYGLANTGATTNQTFLEESATVQYIVPSQTINGWETTGFDASGWSSGAQGIGYENSAADYQALLQTNLPSGTQSAYLRHTFDAIAPTTLDSLTLNVRYDDGFVAFLNGTEIASANAPGTLAWNSSATANHADNLAVQYAAFDVSSFTSLLQETDNVLAVQMLNFGSNSSDMLFQAELQGSSTQFVLGSPFYLAAPTPGAANSAAIVQETVAISQASQTFINSFQVTLSGASQNQVIRYTLDATLPSASSPIYTGPLTISATTQLRASVFETGFAPGRTTSASYSRLGADVQAFQSQLPILLIENFGAGEVPAKGWNQTGQGIQQVARQSAAVSIFGNGAGNASLTGSTDLQTRVGIRVRGAFSSTFPEPQYSVETWSEIDDDSAVNVFGMAEESDWILYAPNPSRDQTLMNNQFLFELANQMGLWAPQVQYVEAFLNTDGGDVTMDDYVGLYVWTEKVKRDSGRLDFDRFAADATSGGWLLSINRMDALPVGEPSATPQFFHTPGPDGILQTPPNTSGQGDDTPRQYNAFINFEHPNGYAINPTQRQSIEGWFAEMEDVLYDRTAVAWNDPVDGYASYIDVDNFIDYFILHNLSKNADGLLLSMWVYNPDPNNGGLLRFGPPWDHDLGSFDGNPTSSLQHRSDRLWYARMFQDPAFVARYNTRWHQWRQTVLSTANMNQVFNDYVQEIGTAAAIRDGVSDLPNRITTVQNWIAARVDAIDVVIPFPMLVQGDVNQDGVLNQLDVSQLIANWGSDTTGLTLDEKIQLGDLNLDGRTSLADWGILYEAWNAQGGAELNLGTLLAAGEADFNADGETGSLDFGIWSSNFGTTSTTVGLAGDANSDGDVDGADFLTWQQNYTPPPVAATTDATEQANLLPESESLTEENAPQASQPQNVSTEIPAVIISGIQATPITGLIRNNRPSSGDLLDEQQAIRQRLDIESRNESQRFRSRLRSNFVERAAAVDSIFAEGLAVRFMTQQPRTPLITEHHDKSLLLKGMKLSQTADRYEQSIDAAFNEKMILRTFANAIDAVLEAKE